MLCLVFLQKKANLYEQVSGENCTVTVALVADSICGKFMYGCNHIAMVRTLIVHFTVPER